MDKENSNQDSKLGKAKSHDRIEGIIANIIQPMQQNTPNKVEAQMYCSTCQWNIVTTEDALHLSGNYSSKQ